MHGQAIAWPAAAPGAEFAVFAPGSRFLGVGRGEPGGGQVAPLRLLAGGNESGCP